MNICTNRFRLYYVHYYIVLFVMQQVMISNLSNALILIKTRSQKKYHGGLPTNLLQLQQQQQQQQQQQHRPIRFQSSLSMSSSDINISALLSQSVTGLITYISLIAYYDRPRGNLKLHTSSFELKQSQVHNAGLGLYITESLPKGTILGTYPGVLRPASKYIQKYNSIPNASVYTWRFTDNQYCIDPTNKYGELQNISYGGTDDYPLSYIIHESMLRFINVPTLLARINEPPIGGGGCNVMATEDLAKREVIFELSRDVVKGEELFMDYGLTYDRSNYG